jgi:aldehyde dehydrogenase (NAD+)
MGDTLNPNTFLGPLADKKQYDRVMSFLEQGKADGAEILTGGVRKGEKGHFIEPTIFMNPDTKSTIYTDEIFGPVLSIKTFKTEDEAIEIANDTTYGLAAALYTSDVTRALRVSSKLEAGSVSINGAFFPTLNTPFGGMKQSGNGREVGRHGLMAYLQPKSVIFKYVYFTSFPSTPFISPSKSVRTANEM